MCLRFLDRTRLFDRFRLLVILYFEDAADIRNLYARHVRTGSNHLLSTAWQMGEVTNHHHLGRCVLEWMVVTQDTDQHSLDTNLDRENCRRTFRSKSFV